MHWAPSLDLDFVFIGIEPSQTATLARQVRCHCDQKFGFALSHGDKDESRGHVVLFRTPSPKLVNRERCPTCDSCASGNISGRLDALDAVARVVVRKPCNCRRTVVIPNDCRNTERSFLSESCISVRRTGWASHADVVRLRFGPAELCNPVDAPDGARDRPERLGVDLESDA
jgi:hypothetical protein